MRDSRKVVPTFESMDQILWCDHSIETFLAVLSYGTIYLYIYVVPTFESVDQRAKKVVSDSPGLVDFAIGLVNSVFNLPDGQVMFYEEFE